MKGCKSCRKFGSGDCFSCTEQDSNFEPKEKKMKVIVEVTDYAQGYYKIEEKFGNNSGCLVIDKRDCELSQEGLWTKEEAMEIFRSLENVNIVKGDVFYFIKRLKELGRIKHSKTAKDRFEELCKNSSSIVNLIDIIEAAREAISEAEKK
jgi:hypothetical protein